MSASSTGPRVRGRRHWFRRLAQLSFSILRALLVGAASFGPPRPPPEPPAPQTTEQASEGSRDSHGGRILRAFEVAMPGERFDQVRECVCGIFMLPHEHSRVFFARGQ